MRLAVVLFSIFVLRVALVNATGGDFNRIDFVASAPYCYHHAVGGGAFNDDTTGKDLDTVESLEGKDFKCGDTISYLVVLSMKDTVVDAVQGVRMKLSWTADSTGQSGVGFGNLKGVSLNKMGRPVENGNNFTYNPANPGAAQPAAGCLGTYGSDGAAFSDGDESIILESRVLTKPLFSQAAVLEAVVVVNGLEAKERVIFRVDTIIYCLPNSHPTGNLQGDILWAVSTSPVPPSISGGQQTVPLRGVGGIQGLNCTDLVVPLVGNDFAADVKTTYPDGGIVYSTLKYSWGYGAYTLVGTGSRIYELHTFDDECSYLHSGEYLYSQSECGCESTKIGLDQPQLFFNASGEYYQAAFTTEKEPITGITVNKYTALSDTQAVVTLYLNAAVPHDIVRADWRDGRIMIFSNVTHPTFTAADFAAPTTTPCNCRRRTDIALVLENSNSVTDGGVNAEKAFATSFIGQFQINADHNQFAVLSYGSSATVQVGINTGTTTANVQAGINLIQCGSKQGCGTGADGDVVNALNAAVAELQKSTRSFVGKAVVFVTNGWSIPSLQVQAAVDAAATAGVEVFVVSYDTIMMAADLDDLTTNPDYLVQRFTTDTLATLDPIDVSSRVCLINDKPCGAACCGVCDTACGTCQAVDSCATVQGCATAYRLVGLCCANVTTDTCPDKKDICAVGTCNAVTNQCDYTPTCVPPAGGDNCYNYNCDTVTGACIKTLKIESDNCTTRKCVSNQIVETPVQCPADDKCTTWKCLPQAGGCKPTDVPLSQPTTVKCKQDVCDPQVGWTTIDVAGCNVACSLNCGTSDKCTNRFCAGTKQQDYHCENTTVDTCTPPNACFTAVCDPVAGCLYTPISCDDKDLCTLDACDPGTGKCVHDAKNCTTTGKCSTATCNAQTGQCETNVKSCDDGIDCTTEECDDSTGNCVVTTNQELCNFRDPCEEYQCDAVQGCIITNVTCPDDGLFCIDNVCVHFAGCNNQSVNCNATNETAALNDCGILECNEDKDQCLKTQQECFSVVAVAGIATGAIIGIVVGVIAFVLCAGGVSWAVYQRVDTGGQDAVVNNPLYRGEKKQGENPLFQNK